MTAEPVPAGPVTIEPPEHPLHALTTYELSRYRRELEHALKTGPDRRLRSCAPFLVGVLGQAVGPVARRRR